MYILLITEIYIYTLLITENCNKSFQLMQFLPKFRFHSICNLVSEYLLHCNLIQFNLINKEKIKWLNIAKS